MMDIFEQITKEKLSQTDRDKRTARNREMVEQARSKWRDRGYQGVVTNDRVNGTADRLPTPGEVQKQVSKQDNRQMVFSPTITMSPSSGNPEADKSLIDTLLERMKSEMMPMMGGGDLAVRLDASLSDRNS